MTAVILAGGIGSRLSSLIADRPKPLASVRGRPFIEYLFDQLVAAHVNDAVICTGHMAAMIEDAFGQNYGPLQLRYSVERQAMGTGGALKLALPMLRSDPVLVLNGDSHCNVDLHAFLAFHRHARAEASIALSFERDARRFGSVHLDYEGRIERFEINAGIYLLSQRLINTMSTGKQISIEREVFPLWCGRGLYGFRSAARLIDIGTPESYAEAQLTFTAGTAASTAG
jgi:NDP-sugar pyrophosphorylase family protein